MLTGCLKTDIFYNNIKMKKDKNLLPTNEVLTIGFPTHTKDINGEVICLGDIVDYAFEGDDPCPFEVIFEQNAFRKKYKKWDKTLTKPLLEFGYEAEIMRLKIVRKTYRYKALVSLQKDEGITHWFNK